MLLSGFHHTIPIRNPLCFFEWQSDFPLPQLFGASRQNHPLKYLHDKMISNICQDTHLLYSFCQSHSYYDHLYHFLHHQDLPYDHLPRLVLVDAWDTDKRASHSHCYHCHNKNIFAEAFSH